MEQEQLEKLNKRVCKALGFELKKKIWYTPDGKRIQKGALPKYWYNDLLAWGALLTYCKNEDLRYSISGKVEEEIIVILDTDVLNNPSPDNGIFTGTDNKFAIAVCIAINERFTYELQEQSKGKV